MNLDVTLIAKLAGEIGYDLATLSPHGSGTRLACTRRVPGRDLEDACVDLDTPFDAVEFSALKAFEAAGWDVRFSTSGVRAYKARVPAGQNRPQRTLFQNLPPVAPSFDSRRPLCTRAA